MQPRNGLQLRRCGRALSLLQRGGPNVHPGWVLDGICVQLRQRRDVQRRIVRFRLMRHGRMHVRAGMQLQPAGQHERRVLRLRLMCCRGPGCTNPLACNFQDVANDDDGTCEFVSCLTSGCTLPNACNYDANAAIHDGSCAFPAEGMDCNGNVFKTPTPTACVTCLKFPVAPTLGAVNFDANATDNDGSCAYANGGCTDAFACNFNHLGERPTTTLVSTVVWAA